MAYSQISYGSAGDDVKKLQKLLNEKGYSLDEDGIFGAKTQAAVKDYQSKNNLIVDGIAGKNTWSSLVAAPKETPKEEAPKEEAPGFLDSDTAKGISQALEEMKANAPGDYTFARQEQWDKLIGEILDREDFSYDVNADALYQQYKDRYTKEGKLAMLDTIGQASAKTGGYGNSYAATAGNQAYQGYLQKLNDLMPQLYAQAYARYEKEGDALYDQYEMLRGENDRQYGAYRDKVEDYYGQLDRLQDRYDTQRELDYREYRDKVEDHRYAQEQAEDKRQFELQYALQQAAAAKKASSGSDKKQLSVSEYNAIHDKCIFYAEQGRYELAAYLEGLVEQGNISEDLAATIMEAFFPEYTGKQEFFDI